eukprot:RCo050994
MSSPSSSSSSLPKPSLGSSSTSSSSSKSSSSACAALRELGEEPTPDEKVGPLIFPTAKCEITLFDSGRETGKWEVKGTKCTQEGAQEGEQAQQKPRKNDY